jgi:hypothetical protein
MLRTGAEVSVFQDTEEIQAGDRWAEKIESALERSAALVVLVSPLWFTREWCTKECSFFRDRNGEHAAVFPIEWLKTGPQGGPHQPLWTWLRTRQWIDGSILRDDPVDAPTFKKALRGRTSATCPREPGGASGRARGGRMDGSRRHPRAIGRAGHRRGEFSVA